MSKPSSRGTPWALPPRPSTMLRSWRSFMSTHALPRDLAHVDAQLVAAAGCASSSMRRQQVVGRADGVEVAGEVQVDVLHGNHLGVAAAGRAALDAEHRAQRRLAQRHDHVLAHAATARRPGPRVVVVLPSPAGVGLMAVTRMSLPGACSSSLQQVVVDLRLVSFRTARGTSRRRRQWQRSRQWVSASVAWAISMSVNTSGPSFSCRGAQAYLAASSIDGAAPAEGIVLPAKR